jgi:hypothetical protein
MPVSLDCARRIQGALNVAVVAVGLSNGFRLFQDAPTVQLQQGLMQEYW